MSLEKLGTAFNKGNLYAALKQLKAEEITLDELMEVCEPQRGGGTTNPSYEENGTTYHWCRYTQGYLPEAEIQMSQGKAKGVGKLQASIAYRIEKRAQELANEALQLFMKGKYEEGGAKSAEGQALAKTVEDPATFTAEAMANSPFNPNKDKTPVVETEEIL